jgi:hypothetical protein
MIVASRSSWLETNQQYLIAALDTVRSQLAQFTNSTDGLEDERSLQQSLQVAQAALPAPAALERLTRLFNLSDFERDVLLLCAGFEMDTRFLRLCAIAQGDSQRAYPTFSLALAALRHSYWNALLPTAPLRRYQLIEVGEGSSLTLSPLRIDERILHYLSGGEYLDTRLAGLVAPVGDLGELVPTQQQPIAPISTILSKTFTQTAPPIVQLCGNEALAKRTIAALACQQNRTHLWVMPAQMVPTLPADLDQFCRLWERETMLSGSVLMLDCEDWNPTEPAQVARLTRLIEQTPSLLFISCRDRLRPSQRRVVNFDIHKPTPEEQHLLWQSALSRQSLDGHLAPQIQTLVSQFNLTATAIDSVCTGLSPDADTEIFHVLWDACRMQSRPRLAELAQPIEPKADWSDLVLPETQAQILRDAAAHVRQRAKVYETWGFGAKGSRGLGISALFAGASGTGKTLAAEVLAHDLRLDLYRIDLSSVVSKYIGETEKNLRQVFDAAEDGGAILLFDEADALFGKRSEVKDSRDRYANIEVSYLLQRMECYPGLAILTTNLKSAIDPAFMRRIRFVTQFPFPDASQRAEIWRRVFPKSTPTQALDPVRLAQLNIAGGNIRNIALNAAFLAADAGEGVQMKHLLQAAKAEYAKLEKSLTESEISGWV